MRSYSRISIDSIMNGIRAELDEAFEDLKDDSVVAAIRYDHDYAEYCAISTGEIVHQAMQERSTMASLFFVERIDDYTFDALKSTIAACVPDAEYREAAQLDRTFLSLTLFMKAHPTHKALFVRQEGQSQTT